MTRQARRQTAGRQAGTKRPDYGQALADRLLDNAGLRHAVTLDSARNRMLILNHGQNQLGAEQT